MAPPTPPCLQEQETFQDAELEHDKDESYAWRETGTLAESSASEGEEAEEDAKPADHSGLASRLVSWLQWRPNKAAAATEKTNKPVAAEGSENAVWRKTGTSSEDEIGEFPEIPCPPTPSACG